MTWRPATDQHAIERVRFAVAFDRPASAKLQARLGREMDERRVDLGFEPMRTQAGHALTFQVTPNGPVALQQPTEVGRWDFLRLSGQGVPVEAFSLDGSTLSYETAEYSRWPVFLDRLMTVAEPVLRQLLRDDDAAVVALEYYDRLWYDGPSAEARPADVLLGLSAVMPPTAMEGGELWHLHRGWFEEHEGRGKLLVQQNLDAQDGQAIGPPAGETRRSIQILTRAEARKGMWVIADDDLRPHLDLMHDRTKTVFKELLSDDMKVQVGIELVKG